MMIIKEMLNKFQFNRLYKFMKKNSTKTSTLTSNNDFAWGVINSYQWRLFKDVPCWVAINDKTSNSKWPTFYSVKQIKNWIKENEK